MKVSMQGLFLTAFTLRAVTIDTYPGGGDSGELADTIQNNASVICPCNFIDIRVSQAR